MPVHYKTGPQLHLLDFATLAARSVSAALFSGDVSNAQAGKPVGDLRFEQSLRFENA